MLVVLLVECGSCESRLRSRKLRLQRAACLNPGPDGRDRLFGKPNGLDRVAQPFLESQASEESAGCLGGDIEARDLGIDRAERDTGPRRRDTALADTALEDPGDRHRCLGAPHATVCVRTKPRPEAPRRARDRVGFAPA